MAEQDIPPPIITAMKIPIIRKGDYDIWSMRMRQYICHTDYNLWDAIVNGDLEEEPTPTTGETSAPPAPKTTKQLAARRNQERVHGAAISKEDINQKFFRSLPSSWNQIALIMRNKPDINEIDIDDLYNNLRVYEDELKRSSGSNSASQNLAFLSSKNTGNINEVMCSFFAQPTTSPQLKNEDFQQIDEDDLEELDLRWQVAMLTVRGEEIHSEDKKELGFQRKMTYLKGIKGEDLMNYDSEREKHSRARLEIQGYELALESPESRILVHETNELAWGEKYKFQNYKLKCKEIKINNLNLELEKVVKERDELKVKIEKWEESSKNLDELLNTGVLTRTGLITPFKQNEKRVVHTVSTARPVSTTRPVSNVRRFAPKIAQTSGAIRPIYPRMDNGNLEDHLVLHGHAVVMGCSSHMTDELKFNLFSISQMCNKKISVLFTDTEFLILSPSFKLLDESQVVHRAPRQNDVYSLDLKNIIPSGVSILTLKPLPKIDPKDKGKKVSEEKAESEGVNEAEIKFAQLANDEEIARKVQEEWEAKEEKKKLAEEEATKAASPMSMTIIQARLMQQILAKKLKKERE
ncbi:hypothetical protein Tco_1540047 [Tanacetum coccineum]